LVEYPSRLDFERMVTTPEYQARAALRTAALEDSRLIAITGPQHIGRVAWWLLMLSVRVRGGW
jgi:predicted component of type VI protein secretion system